MALNECLTFANDKKMSSMSRVTCWIMIKINSKSKVAVMIKNRKVAVMTKKNRKVAVMTKNRKWSQDSLSPVLAVDKRGENINL